MSTDDIKTTISHLKSKVSNFTVKDDFSSFSKNNLLSEKLQSPFVLYGILPIIIVILLIFIKPKIITQKTEVEGESPTYKISLKKFILTMILILFFCYLLIFSYLYKKK